MPKALDKCIESNAYYYRLRKKIDDEPILAITGSDAEHIDEFMRDKSESLVECVLLGETSWIFVTHIDTYVQNDKYVDDCALPKTSKYDEQPTAVLVEKNEFRNSWREIVVRWGNLEFLVQAGFCGERGSNNRKAFLGSALSSTVSRILLDTEYDVIIRLVPPEVISSVRFLRNYCKSAASKTWSFESKRFATQGFRACHPLAVDRSQARKNLRYKDKASLASYILQLVIEKTYTCQSRQKCLSILAKSLDLSHLKAEQWTNITTIGDALKMLPEKSTFIQPLNLINRIYKQLSNGPVDMNSFIMGQDFSKELLEIYKRCIYPTMRTCNANAIRSFKA